MSTIYYAITHYSNSWISLLWNTEILKLSGTKKDLACQVRSGFDDLSKLWDSLVSGFWNLDMGLWSWVSVSMAIFIIWSSVPKPTICDFLCLPSPIPIKLLTTVAPQPTSCFLNFISDYLMINKAKFLLITTHVVLFVSQLLYLSNEDEIAPTLLEKTLESPLDCKEIRSVHSKDQSWVFIGRTDAEAETPILWPPHEKSGLAGKDPDSGRDWGQKEKGTTEDEIAGWHHWLNGHEFEQTPGVGDGQGGLACCDSWGHKESDTTKRLIWTELNIAMLRICSVQRLAVTKWYPPFPFLAPSSPPCFSRIIVN